MQRASSALHNNQTLTSVTLIGGRDVTCLGGLQPDLWVGGGGLIEKNFSVMGNICVGNFIVGNISSELILVDHIMERHLGDGIQITGNIFLDDPLPAVSGGTGNDTYEIGDILYADTTSSLARRAIGNEGDVLIVTSGLPVWAPVSSASGGTVTLVNTGTGLTGGPITVSGTISLADTTVVPGSYTNANLTVNQQGQITAIANGSGGIGTLIAVTTPSNANAAIAGVAVGELYRNNLDPAIVYIRTA